MQELARSWNTFTRNKGTFPRDFPHKLVRASALWAFANCVGDGALRWGTSFIGDFSKVGMKLD